jgi:hypothetical protein
MLSNNALDLFRVNIIVRFKSSGGLPIVYMISYRVDDQGQDINQLLI